MPRRVAIIEAPSIPGQFPGGTETLPKALMSAGLGDRLRARRAGEVVPPRYEREVDPATGVRNARGIAAYMPRLADAVAAVVDGGEFALVLGGDCSIVLGGLLALRRRGRYGLLFVDGHADFYQPEALPDGEAAAMDLAFATGRGPPIVTRFEGFHPLVRDEDVVVLGRRDAEDAEAAGSQRVEDTAVEVIDLAQIRRLGAAASVAKALDRLTRPELDGIWIHLDADVLDDALMPALDYRMAGGGFTFDELASVLAAAMASGKATGMDVTNFNSRHDADGASARNLVEALAHGLAEQ